MRRCLFALLVSTLLSLTMATTAKTTQGLGAVLRIDCEGYKQAGTGVVEYHLKAGTFCGFFDYKKMRWNEPKKEKGFVQVVFFENNKGGHERKCWVREENLAYFHFTGPRKRGGWSGFSHFISPVGGVGGIRMHWLKGFLSAAIKKANQIGIEPATTTFATGTQKVK